MNTLINRRSKKNLITGALLFIAPFALSACISMQKNSNFTAPIDTQYLPEPDTRLNIAGLGPCTDQTERTFNLKRSEPVIVLVHGCYGSAGRYRALAQLFSFQGQQAICFSYDDRASLVAVGKDLRRSLDSLAAQTDHPQITLIGHSQGGLIARQALTNHTFDTPHLDQSQQQLITLSAPFSGIRAADHCASTTARIVSLGLVIPICMAISGDKWYEITHASDFIRKPGRLDPRVEDHLAISTDEEGSCRTWDGDRCTEDDFVFSLAEQELPREMVGAVVRTLILKAGHAEIVGNGDNIPQLLINTLQEEGVLSAIPQSKRAAFNKLLETLYLSGEHKSDSFRHATTQLEEDSLSLLR